GQTLQRGAEREHVARRRRSRDGAREKALEVVEAGQTLRQIRPELRAIDDLADRVVACRDRLAVEQGRRDPGLQATPAQRGGGAVDRGEERARAGAVA